jgi:uncharacterized protein YkwD
MDASRWFDTDPRRKSGHRNSLTTEPLGPGIHRFEAFGVGPSGLEVLANFPVSVGSISAPAPGVERALSETDPAAALLELMNGARARAGRKPLIRAVVLDRIAQAHTTDMVANRFVAHHSPMTGDPGDRVRASGVRLLLFGENVSQAASAAEAHRMLMDSPGHRQNILDPRFTHVGIGTVSPQQRQPRVIVTEVFGRFPEPSNDSTGFAARLFQQTNQLRTQRNLPALARKRALDAGATKLAARLAADPKLRAEDIKSLVHPSDFPTVAGRQIALLAVFPAAPEDIIVVSNLLEPDLRSVGIGFVQAEPNADTPRTNIVVFVLAK